MTSKYSTLFRLTAIFVLFSIAEAYVMANPGALLFGRLATSANNVISVNGSEARTGTTILSGAQLQTPENTTATVRLDSGTLELSPDTNLTLTFSKDSVDVSVSSGWAVLTTNKGINGSITFNGNTERTDPLKEVSTVEGGAAQPSAGNNWSKTTTIKIGFAIVIIIVIILIVKRPSPRR